VLGRCDGGRGLMGECGATGGWDSVQRGICPF